MDFVEVTARLDEPGILNILKLAVGYPTPGKLAGIVSTYRSNASWSAYALLEEDAVVAVIGVEEDARGSLRIRHIATRPDAQRRGLGRLLIERLQEELSTAELYAETDTDAVRFYKRCGFTVRSLGEQYPGVERFACNLSLSPPEKC